MGAVMRALPGAMTVGNRRWGHIWEMAQRQNQQNLLIHTLNTCIQSVLRGSQYEPWREYKHCWCWQGSVPSRAERGGTIRVDFLKECGLTCCCQVTSVVSDPVRPHKWQPARLHHPWDFPGKNTGVGCHFLLQCMKVKGESEVAQSCPTLSNTMDCSLPGLLEDK